jgi:hypothetical protein
MTTNLRIELNKRINLMPKFPGLKLCGRNLFSKTNFTDLVLKGSKLSADENRSVRSYIIFCLLGLISEKRLKCWYYHIIYALGYHTIEWTLQKRAQWSLIRNEFLTRFASEFKHYSSFEFPKYHDPGIFYYYI